MSEACELKLIYTLGAGLASRRGDHYPAHRGWPVHLPHQDEILISEAGRLEVPSHAICRLHQISLPY